MQTNSLFQFFVPTKILFGRGQVSSLHTCALPGKKALIVISDGKSVRVNGYLEKVERQLEMAGVEYIVFDGISANPTAKSIIEGAAAARGGCCDFIIGLGGGSPIDASKAIAVMAVNDGQLWDYISAGSGKRLPVKNKPLPVVAIVTTAGTGSETDPAFVVSNEATNEKIGMYLPELFPVIAVVDPELMTTVPPRFTAFQGFDALFHSTEGIISNKAHMISDMLSYTAIELVSRNLPAAVKNGMDLDAREKVAMGSTLSGMQLAVGSLVSSHSLEHAMSAYHPNLPHGAGLILVAQAYYRRFTGVPELRDRFVRMARVMGMENATEPEDFITVLGKLMCDCGLGNLSMSEYGIIPEEFAKFAGNAKFTMGAKFLNDYLPLSEEDCIEIYRDSYNTKIGG